MKIINTEFIKGNTEFYDFDISIIFLNKKDSKKSGYYITFLPIFKYEHSFDKLNEFKLGKQVSSNINEDEEILYKILKNRKELYKKYILEMEKILMEEHLKTKLNKDDKLSNKEDYIENINYSTIQENNTESLRDIEKKIISYHEAGHALIGIILQNIKIEKISIIPNEESLGCISNTIEKQPYLYTETELFNKIKFLLAGKVAEELIFNEHSTGCYDDLKESSSIAIDMVCKYAMGNNSLIFINPINNREITPENMKKIETILYKANKETFDTLKKYKVELIEIANELYKRKELHAKDVEKILKNSANKKSDY